MVLRGRWCADPATLSSPAPGSVDLVAYEQKAGLRPRKDHLPDRERRQQVCTCPLCTQGHSAPELLLVLVLCFGM